MAENTFFRELQRRNVIKAAVAYLAVAWVVLQAASIIFPTLNAPESAMRYLLIGLVVLFPAWIIFAWVYEYTPQGFKKTDDTTMEESVVRNTSKRMNGVIIASLSLAVLLLLADRIFNLSEDIIEGINYKSIAVLPFENKSGDDDIYFADGITEDILTQISKIGDLRVLSRFTLKEYDATGKTPSQIGKELKVAHLLAGSVRRRGDELRIGCQLINTQNELETWAQSYDRRVVNVFELQSEIAQEVAKHLKAQMSTEEKSRINSSPTQNLIAYNSFLRGKEEYNRRTPSSNEAAIKHFKEALSLDAEFGLAWAGLSDATVQSVWTYRMRSHEYVDSALIMSQNAVDLSPESAEAWKAIGYVYMMKGLYDESINANRKAIEKNPNYWPAIVNMANILSATGQKVEAIMMYEKATEINPISLFPHYNMANAYRVLEMYSEAFEKYEFIKKLRPESLGPHFGMVSIYLSNGDTASAKKTIDSLVVSNTENDYVLETAAFYTSYFNKPLSKQYFENVIRKKRIDPVVDHRMVIEIGRMLWEERKIDSANVVLNNSLSLNIEQTTQRPDRIEPIINIGKIHAIRGNRDDAILWLRNSIEKGNLDYRLMMIDPAYSSIKDSAEFIELMKEVAAQVKKMRNTIESENRAGG